MSRKPRKQNDDNEAELDELGIDPGESGAESGGQSGDAQGLSGSSEVSEESVEELAEDEQAFECGVISGVEDAGDHPERPVHIHEYRRPSH